MGWMQLNSWWQIFTLISKGELHGILLGMITWWVVQLKLEREQRHWHPLTIFFEGWRYNTIRNRTPNQGDWGWGGGGRGWKTGLLLILKENVLLSYTCYWPKWYLFCIPGLKCYISFNCCRHTVFINKSLNQEDDSVSSSNKVLLHTTMKHFPTLSYIACSRLPSRAYIFARLSLTRDPYYLIA